MIDLNRMLGPDGVYTASVDGLARAFERRHPRQRWTGGALLQRQILPEVDRIGMERRGGQGRTR